MVVKAVKNREELNHSRMLRQNTWGDHPEVNEFVNRIFNDHFPDLKKIRKKHLKVVLLDLYVCWYYDPDMCLGVHFNKNKYKAGSVNNALHISELTIPVVKRLSDDGFIYMKLGNNVVINKITRIWPSEKLIALFEKASFNILDIREAPNTNPIVLRTEDPNYIPKNSRDKIPKIDVDYEPDEECEAMIKVGIEYNELLYRTHIDCGHLTKPFIERKKGRNQNKPAKIQINQSNKFVRRIFNVDTEHGCNYLWGKGGRFYGGFWQQLGKEDRSHIRLNGELAIELDFSGWHVALCYARKDINYYDTYGFKADPYEIEVPEIEGEQHEDYKRWLIKTVMLVAINAKDEASTIGAVRHTDTPDDPDIVRPDDLKLTDVLILSILNKLKEKHSDIAEFFCSGAGIELQNIDGRMTESIIKKFTADEVPVLTIHDSYMVPESYNHVLFSEMLVAFKAIGLEGKHLGGEGLSSLESDLAFTKVKQLGYVDELYDDEEPAGGKEHCDMDYQKSLDFKPTPAYNRRLQDFQKWKANLP